MKKQILILVTSFILLISTSYARASDSKIPYSVESVFSRDFFYASNVRWENVSGYYKASFTVMDKTLFVFYTEEGEFMGMATNILSDKLPAALQSKIKSDYSNFWITDLFKFDVHNTPGYFIELQNADQKILLKAEGNMGWQFFRSVKKP